MWKELRERQAAIDRYVFRLRENSLGYVLALIFYGLTLPPWAFIITLKTALYYTTLLRGGMPDLPGKVIITFLCMFIPVTLYCLAPYLALSWISLLLKFAELVRIFMVKLLKKVGFGEYGFLTRKELKHGCIFFGDGVRDD
ncbi:hypothetical protein [Desulfofundulus salinus]|nr:hypothetical protein [Desulfofundulus salinum]